MTSMTGFHPADYKALPLDEPYCCHLLLQVFRVRLARLHRSTLYRTGVHVPVSGGGQRAPAASEVRLQERMVYHEKGVHSRP